MGAESGRSPNFSINSLFALQGDLPEHLLNVWKLVSYGFAHDARTPWHLAFNMLALFFFGRAVEQILGRVEFYRFYFVSVVIAGLRGYSVPTCSPVGFLPATAI